LRWRRRALPRRPFGCTFFSLDGAAYDGLYPPVRRLCSAVGILSFQTLWRGLAGARAAAADVVVAPDLRRFFRPMTRRACRASPRSRPPGLLDSAIEGSRPLDLTERSTDRVRSRHPRSPPSNHSAPRSRPPFRR